MLVYSPRTAVDSATGAPVVVANTKRSGAALINCTAALNNIILVLAFAAQLM